MFIVFVLENSSLKKGIAFLISEKVEPFFSVFLEQPLPHPTDIFRIAFSCKIICLMKMPFLFV